MNSLENVCCICIKSGVILQRLSDINIGEHNENYYSKLTKFMPDMVR